MFNSFIIVLILFKLGSVFATSTIDKWMFFEQSRLNRSVDPRKILPPDVSNQSKRYRPDSKNWFDLQSMWIPESELDVVAIEKMVPTDLKSELIKTQNGKKYFRFFIHPESMDLYKDWLNRYPLLTEHSALATSSSRSVLVRSISDPSKEYFAKLSLNVKLGGVDRTIPTSEIARSVGSTEYLVSKQKIKDGFQLVPEVLGVAPKGKSRGGQIIRLIPDEVKTGRSVLVPLFSLYAQDANGKTLLQELSLNSHKTPLEFTHDHLLKPFSKAWVEGALNKSFVSENHAQNLMLELNAETKKPTGRFFLRDGGGFYINPRTPLIKKGELSKLPTFYNFEWDYQKFAKVAESQSLDTYFNGGFLYNVDNELVRIDKNYKQGAIYESFWSELRTELIKETNLKEKMVSIDDLKFEMENVLRKAREAKAAASYRNLSYGLGRSLKIGFYTGTFDPPHLGHLELVSSAKKQLGLDIIYVSPNLDVSHKRSALPYGHRKEMSKLAFAQDGIIVANPELERTLMSKGVDSAIETLMSQYDKDTQFFRIMGDDRITSLVDNPKIKTFKNLTFVTSSRLDGERAIIPQKIGESAVLEIQIPEKGYSSTQVRSLIKEGKVPQQLNENVWNYIETNRLYRALPIINQCLNHVLSLISPLK